jgi:O-antigen/teichoic acid export membrane protein
MSVRADLKRLVARSAAYGAGAVFLRAVGFLLLPVYTRFLTPEDYGIVAVANTVALMLGLLMPLGLHGALSRFYFRTSDDAERRIVGGTLWLATLGTAAVVTIVLQLYGAPLFAWLFPDVPFSPYLRLAVWLAFVTVFPLVPQNLLQAREQARLYVAITTGAAILTIACTLAFVVVGRMGARGYLLGTLVSGALAAVPYTVLALRSTRPAVRWDLLRAALAYSLPLVPHGVAGWVLEMSDRAILARFVPIAEVGVYSLGYQLGSALSLILTAFTSAWVPYLFRTLSARGTGGDAELARAATYYAACLCFAALGIGLLVEQVLVGLAPPAFAGASRIAVWVAAGYVLNGLYVLPVGFLFWKERTGLIPVVTVMAGLLNVGMNLLLVPRFGAIAAAWATFAAYGAMLVLAYAFAQRLHPFPYEYGRLLRVVGVAALLLGIGLGVAAPTPALTLGWRTSLWLAYPGVLGASGFFTQSEAAVVARMFRRARAALS